MDRFKNSSTTSLRAAESFCWQILPRVSRSFAIGISRLPKSLGLPVMISYLIARIADTIEDNPRIHMEMKRHLLETLHFCLQDPLRGLEETFTIASNQGDESYAELMLKTKMVFEVFRHLPATSRSIISEWLGQMIHGMSEFVDKNPNGIRIQSWDEYRRYCFSVAGTVGHLLTELWGKTYRKLSNEKVSFLQNHSANFGEALQSVNILKDIAVDYRETNSIFIPQDVLLRQGSSHEKMFDVKFIEETSRAVKEVAIHARQRIVESLEYVEALPKSLFSVRYFCIFPLLLANATLEKISQTQFDLNLQTSIKVDRAAVKSILFKSVIGSVSDRFLKWQITN